MILGRGRGAIHPRPEPERNDFPMIKSMTAFARQERRTPWGALSVELRTVNHRFLDIGLRLPEELRGLEGRIREALAARLRRGKVECTIKFQVLPGADAPIALNLDLLKRLLEANSTIEGMMENPARTPPLELLKWPGVLDLGATDVDALQEEAMAVLADCLEELTASRLREGAKMKALIEQRCAALLEQVVAVRRRLPEILEGQRQRLRSRVEELRVEVDAARFEQELAYLAQKIDVEEELDRIQVHVDEVRRVLEQDEPVGRRLDFLMQELNREANTLGSKSVDAQTTRAAVEMKVLIEQMREQIQNVE